MNVLPLVDVGVTDALTVTLAAPSANEVHGDSSNEFRNMRVPLVLLFPIGVVVKDLVAAEVRIFPLLLSPSMKPVIHHMRAVDAKPSSFESTVSVCAQRRRARELQQFDRAVRRAQLTVELNENGLAGRCSGDRRGVAATPAVVLEVAATSFSNVAVAAHSMNACVVFAAVSH